MCGFTAVAITSVIISDQACAYQCIWNDPVVWELGARSWGEDEADGGKIVRRRK